MKEPRVPCPFLCGAKGGELHGWVEITGKCNLECTYCYTDSSLKVEEDLSTEEVKDIIDAFKNLKTSTLAFSGGEPCLRKDLPELMQYAHRSIETKLVTNGTIITQEIMDALADGNVQVQLSIDTVTPQQYERSRGKPFLSRVQKNIDQLLEHGIDIVLAVTLTEHTMRTLFDVFNYAIEKNIVNIHLGSLIPEGRGKADKPLPRQLLQNLYEFQKDHFELISIDLVEDFLIPIITEEKREVYCNAMMGNTMEIGFDGTVYICGGMRELTWMKLGNIREESLTDIYETAVSNNRMVYIPVDRLDACKACEYKYICSGGCRARAYHFSGGDIMAAAPECDDVKELIRIILHDYERGELDAYAMVLRHFLRETGVKRRKIF